MNTKKDASNFYSNLDILFKKILSMLNDYERSHILQDYFFKQFLSLIYANLINNFFTNLTKENTKELKLSKEKIKLIKKEYEKLQKNVKKDMLFLSENNVREEDYFNFKLDLKNKFPEFLKIIVEIEKIIHIKDLKKYITNKRKEINKAGNLIVSLDITIRTKYLELYVSEYHKFPTGKDFEKSLKKILMTSLVELSNELRKNLEKDKPRMLNEHRKIREEFESRLYKMWKAPFDLLESLIVICLEAGEDKKNKLSKGRTITNPKQVALIKIHARAIQISYEILALVKSGFADGAHARWRSLHELAMITFFLRENNEDVSKRYLEHEIMKKFKESQGYKKHYKKLGYPPLTRKESYILRKEHKKLLQKYGSEFECRSGFEWIPTSILANRNFRALEEHVKMDKFHPFYDWSSNSVHSGSKGFQRLGVMKDLPNDSLVVGPTDYGFADPIDSTAISLLHITSNLLLLESNFDDILTMKVIQKYRDDVGQNALDVQKKIENEYTGRK
jgi:hypothetical protein